MGSRTLHVLLAEDDPALAESTARALRSQGWEVDHTPRGEPVPGSLAADPYDLLILDIGLAGIDGFETLRRVREQGLQTPVLILTARDAVEDRVRGLESGADDYLVKPFALAELIARVRVLTRRHRVRAGSELSMGSLRMDLTARRAWIGEQPLELSVREWSVLEYLLGRVGHVIGKEQILQAISGWGDALSENAVEVYVSRLRPKIEPAGLRIRAVRGFGYLVEEAATTTAAEPDR
ncbi:response regulator [Rivibacter subsaxonicus]|uniref:DNA-binding response OmpR family regulator n=1 Tax=Rivibacter subsaxonicus TaxID=457575 RepID=A0A4Q7VGP1_9BURK|nr:response regulator transcription factor [Rivibacter subsaxonicus]RZT95210.1 DNA-binding response OmpR family regulator [Rivibacter subsaxonicus]